VIAIVGLAVVALAPDAGAAASSRATKARATRARTTRLSSKAKGKAEPAPKKRVKVTWSPAPAATAAIHPGVQTFTRGTDASGATVDNQCTANFVFTQETATRTRVFLGQAAHCAGTGQATETNGCAAATLPLGAHVDISGSNGTTYTGVIAYSSWLSMQARKETDPDACLGNDLALIELSDAAAAVTNPSVPFWGGPKGISAGAQPGTEVYTYGNSGLRAGVEALSPKVGELVDSANGGWTYDLYTVSPGVPGDSGSAFLDASGRALGDLSTLSVLPLPASNQVSDVAHELSYLSQHSGFGEVTLVAGTEPFTPLV